jgi:hypothetical protein
MDGFPRERKEVRPRAGSLAEPLFVLAPPRSFTSVIGSMIGRHPQLYGIAETHLFTNETVREWWQRCAEANWEMNHGLLRIVAELFFGGQTDETIRLASGWLRRQLHLTTGALMELLVAQVHPLVLVDKSPSIVWLVESMRRAHSMFPGARYIHLLRHPRAHAESVFKYLRERPDLFEDDPTDPDPSRHWAALLGSFPPAPPGPGEEADPPSGDLDPQWSWYTLHRNILTFLEEVPAERVYRLHGEDVLTDPAAALKPLCRWLAIRDDDDAMEEMKHPERSPFACIGPKSARLGMDGFFLRRPALRPVRAAPQRLEGPLPWRKDGRGFAPAVLRLAREFGYE